MDNRAPAWVVPVMRAGYTARGTIYAIVGVLALLAAWHGGQAEGTTDSMAQLRKHPLGVPALWLIAVGLVAYAVWRGLDAAVDLEDYGHNAKGVIARIGQTVSGIIHLGLAFSAARSAMGGGSGGQSGTESLTSKVLAMPGGAWIVGAAGLIVIGSGIYYVHKGWAEKYREHLRASALMEKLNPAAKAGLVAHGIVIGMIGVFLIYAAVTHSPEQAGGLGQAFETVRQAAFGRILLGLLALGMIGFAIYCWIEAVYRIVPRRDGNDVKTLARKAEGKARQAMA